MNLPNYFRLAKKASLNSVHIIKLGACILSKNRVISVGFNQRFKTNPFIRKFDPHKTIHAEMSAIFRIKNKSLLKGATMVVYREKNEDKSIGMAKPCPVCQEIMKHYGFEKMIYTTDFGYMEEMI